MDEIIKRRSIRKYKADPVPAELVNKLLTAAMCAPSAGEEQPWHFIVIDDPEKLKAIPRYVPDVEVVKAAPLAILVCGDGAKESCKGYWTQDCASATENILIEAEGLGLGSMWLGVYPDEDRVLGLRWLLGLPTPVMPFALVTIGYPAEIPPLKESFNAERIHRNKW